MKIIHTIILTAGWISHVLTNWWSECINIFNFSGYRESIIIFCFQLIEIYRAHVIVVIHAIMLRGNNIVWIFISGTNSRYVKEFEFTV